MDKRGEIIIEGVIVITIVLLLCAMTLEEVVRMKGISFEYFQNHTYNYEKQLNDLVKELRIEKGAIDGK